MKQGYRLSLQGLVFVFAYAVALCYIGIVGHNHPFDGEFHDNCPACHWELQTKAEDTTTLSMIESFQNSIPDYDWFECIVVPDKGQESLSIINQKRAPPFTASM